MTAERAVAPSEIDFGLNKLIPTTREAVALLGGAARLAKLRSHTLKLATATLPTKLQLSIAIGRKYLGRFAHYDLDNPVREKFMHPFQVEHMVYLLNNDDGPWAVGLSGNALTWQPVTTTEFSSLVTCNDFLEMIFHHLK